MEKMNLNSIILDRMASISKSKDLAGATIFPDRLWICGSSTRPAVSFNSMYNIVIHK